jgi:hypothetical protein
MEMEREMEMGGQGSGREKRETGHGYLTGNK